MIRQIIHIDEEKCDGCGLCARACHEGAIDIIDGKARLVREHFCDGLGDCLPNCPTGAITFEEREAPAYDEAAVKKSQAEKQRQESIMHQQGAVCQGPEYLQFGTENRKDIPANTPPVPAAEPVSRLNQWPCQIKLLPVQAPFYEEAELLIAADCTAYAYANMHEDFMKGRITVIGCPKLDAVDYSGKLTEILRYNNIRSVTLVRMEVPCCGGLQRAAEAALYHSGKRIPWQVITISRDGKIL